MTAGGYNDAANCDGIVKKQAVVKATVVNFFIRKACHTTAATI